MDPEYERFHELWNFVDKFQIPQLQNSSLGKIHGIASTARAARLNLLSYIYENTGKGGRLRVYYCAIWASALNHGEFENDV